MSPVTYCGDLVTNLPTRFEPRSSSTTYSDEEILINRLIEYEDRQSQSQKLAKRVQSSAFTFGTSASDILRRWKSSDAGDVIGIDLGTTNSCVAIMVSCMQGNEETNQAQELIF